MIFFFTLIFFCFLSNFSFSQNWQSLGPNYYNLDGYGYVGRADCVVANPENINEIYVGAATGGFWKTTDGGKNWRCTTDHLAGGISSIALSPENKGVIFATTSFYTNGLLRSEKFGYGIYQSEDFGETWKVLELEIKPEDKVFFREIIFSPFNPKIIYAVARQNVYKSENNGETWQILNTKLSEKQLLRGIKFRKTKNSEEIYLYGHATLLKSTDGGKTWTDIYDQLIDFETRVTIDITKSGRIFAISNTENKYQNLITFSDDGGKTWADKKRQRLTGTRHALTIKVESDTSLWFGGVKLYKCNNFPVEKFQQSKGKLHADIMDIHYPTPASKDTIFVATDGGVNRTFDGGKTWENINGNLSLTQCYSMAISEIDTNKIMIGTHDNGTYLIDSTQKWKHIYGCDGGTTIIDHTNPNIVYLSCNRSFKRRNLTGKKWAKSLLKLAVVYDAKAIQHTDNERVIYASVFDKKTSRINVLRSENMGDNFQSPDSAFYRGWQVISAMEQSKADTNTFYIASYDHWGGPQYNLVKTDDNGKSWETIFSKKIDTKILDIEFDNRNSDNVWLVFNEFVDTLKVLQTTDGGKSWQNISYNLPNEPVYSIEFYEPENLLLIGTNSGVYYLYADEQVWLPYGKNFPKVAVTDIEINYRTKKIFVATYGRGVWSVSIF